MCATAAKDLLARQPRPLCADPVTLTFFFSSHLHRASVCSSLPAYVLLLQLLHALLARCFASCEHLGTQLVPVG